MSQTSLYVPTSEKAIGSIARALRSFLAGRELVWRSTTTTVNFYKYLFEEPPEEHYTSFFSRNRQVLAQTRFVTGALRQLGVKL